MNSSVVALFFFCLFCCAAPATYAGVNSFNSGGFIPGNFTAQHSATDWGFISPFLTPSSAKLNFVSIECALPRECPEPPAPTYKGLIQSLWALVLSDAKTSSLAVSLKLRNFYLLTAATLSKGFRTLVHNFCWLMVYVWFSILWRTIATIWHLVISNFGLVVCAALLYALTLLLAKVASWLFGQMPIYLALTLIKFPRYIWQRRPWGKSSRVYEEEKCCEQYLSFKIKQDPPKKCQVVFQNDEGKHCGYGTCIRLFNGTNGLITAYHVASTATKVVSTRTGTKIPLSQFEPLMVSQQYDQALYAGPKEWESLLGCKGVNFVPAKTLGACNASIYFIEKDGSWGCSNAKIEGQLKFHDVSRDGGKTFRDALPGQLSVLSNTEPGYSGAGYFNGKTLVAVHVGGSLECEDSDSTYNVAVPVLPKAGLTAPLYVFETTAPTSGVFDTKTVEHLTEIFDREMRWMNSKREKGEVLWADMEDDLPYQAESDQETISPSQNLSRRLHKLRVGKREERLRPLTNRKSPRCPKKRGLRHPSKRYTIRRTTDEDVGGEDCRQYKPERGREGLSGGNFRAGPEEAEPFVQTTTELEERRRQWRSKADNYSRYFHSHYQWEVSGAPQEVAGFRHCGKAPQWYHPKQKQECGWGEEVIRKHPALGQKTSGFGWPQFGSQAELKSLRLQAARWLDRAQSAEVPSPAERERVIRRLVVDYRQAQSVNPVATMSGELLWDDFLQSFKEAVSSLQLDAGVGVPYVALGKPTHRSLVEDPEMLPVLARLTFDRLEKLSKVDAGRLTAEELVQQGLCDPIRVFVKGEPHKKSKLDEGRYRLIMSVSLVDQLVARVLFQEQNKKEIQQWRVVPSKPGFGLSTDGQVSEFTEALAHKVGVTPQELIANWRDHLVPTDCSGFDWSVADWMLDDDIEVRNRLTRGLTPITAAMRRAWKHCIANSVLCLSDGTLLAQCVPGVQKSGSYNTSSSNSRIRVMCAYHAGATWCCAMGDDALESVDSNLAEYKRLGLKVEVSGKLEFCSHIFESPSLATPVNVGKMLYKLIFGYNPGCANLEVIANYLAACFSVFNELRHDPELVLQLYEWLVLPVQAQKI
ncbi:RNA-dependent RNA polymerase [Siratro latent polerovirus]|uniref:RNA-dependent RNA polymerase n=1 Tax=Siratro latent polerovirus TaxID=2562543 RepID=A0A565DCN1_9VIRU|nr:RNA-dependent RNA polymerase [Siratro latent polerovirus]